MLHPFGLPRQNQSKFRISYGNVSDQVLAEATPLEPSCVSRVEGYLYILQMPFRALLNVYLLVCVAEEIVLPWSQPSRHCKLTRLRV
jgi:hypothetical protein